MKKLTRFDSFQEMKESAAPAAKASDLSIKRHAAFEDSLKILRKEYIKSKSSLDKN